MTAQSSRFEVGQFVTLVSPSGVDRVIGRIVATEVYTDFHGMRAWFYVAWFKPDGSRGDVEKYAHQEIMHHDEM